MFSWLLLIQPRLCLVAVEMVFTWAVCWEILSANRLATYPWTTSQHSHGTVGPITENKSNCTGAAPVELP